MTTRTAALASVAAVLAVGAVLVLAAAARDGGDGDASRWSSTVAGLCTAAAKARDGDTDAARRTFYDESHDGIHELADAVTGVDRSVAARLLEAHEVVHAGIEAPTRSLPTGLEALADRARGAVRALGDPVPPPCST